MFEIAGVKTVALEIRSDGQNRAFEMYHPVCTSVSQPKTCTKSSNFTRG
jgi:hypothetical protein